MLLLQEAIGNHEDVFFDNRHNLPFVPPPLAPGRLLNAGLLKLGFGEATAEDAVEAPSFSVPSMAPSGP